MASYSKQKLLILFVILLTIVARSISMEVYRCNNDTIVCGCSKRSRLTLKIRGGSSAGLSNWDWMVSLRDVNNTHFCGGSIISEWYIITAAHCLWKERHRASENTVCAGSFHLSDSCHHSRSIENVSFHPLYDAETFENDIALIRLTTPLDLTDSSLSPICLPSGHNSKKYPKLGTDVVVIGWGELSTGKTPDELQEVELKIMDKSSRNCPTSAKYDSMLCAGSSGKGTRPGDSGGPLMILKDSKYWELIGIHSFGKFHRTARTANGFIMIAPNIEFIRSVITQTLTKDSATIQCSCQCPLETHAGFAYSTDNSLDGCLHACKEDYSNSCNDSNTYACLGKYCAYSDAYHFSTTEIATVNEPTLSQCLCVSTDGAKSNEELNDTSFSGGNIYNCTIRNADTFNKTREYRKSTCLLIWSNGDKYIGDASNSKRAGFGIMTWSNGDRYIGDWVDDKENGKGNFVSPTGDKYSGEFQDGKLHGRGTYEYADGTVYNGDWVDDLKSGNGTMIWTDGENYTGQWFKGSKHGYGIYAWPDGEKYVGDWVWDEMTGKGLLSWPSGEKYEGQFIDGFRNGRGIYYYANGDRYVGDWVDGDRAGDGVMFFKNGDMYMGDWVNDKRTGKGVYVWHDGDKYEGQFKNDRRHGKGTMHDYFYGTKYTGEWVEDVKEGKGIQTWSDGDQYEGEFKDGEVHGWGKMKYSNGTIVEGMWLNGRFLDI